MICKTNLTASQFESLITELILIAQSAYSDGEFDANSAYQAYDFYNIAGHSNLYDNYVNQLRTCFDQHHIQLVKGYQTKMITDLIVILGDCYFSGINQYEDTDQMDIEYDMSDIDSIANLRENIINFAYQYDIKIGSEV